MFIMFPIFLFLLIHWTVGYNPAGDKTMILSDFFYLLLFFNIYFKIFVNFLSKF